MNLSVSGTAKTRIRINLVLFTIAGPWKTEAFDWNCSVDTSKILSAKIPRLDAELQAGFAGDTLTLDAVGYDQDVRLISVKVPVFAAPLPFRWEPIKGIVVEGEANVG